MCPALIFAASRKESVIGRTEILIVSMSTRKGFSQSGAPLGSRPAIKDFGDASTLDRIRANHRGSPKDRVKSKWLVVLNIYGSSPHRLNVISKMNSGTSKELKPFKCSPKVRELCVFISLKGPMKVQKSWLWDVHNAVLSNGRANPVITQNRSGDRLA